MSSSLNIPINLNVSATNSFPYSKPTASMRYPKNKNSGTTSSTSSSLFNDNSLILPTSTTPSASTSNSSLKLPPPSADLFRLSIRTDSIFYNDSASEASTPIIDSNDSEGELLATSVSANSSSNVDKTS